MPDYSFPGGVNPRETGSFVEGDFEVETASFNMPKGPTFADGYQGGLITHVRAWFSPYSGSKGVRIGLGGTYTNWVTKPQAGAADTEWIPLGAVKPPGPLAIRLDVEYGGMTFGRSVGNGSTTGVGFSYTWNGAIAGQARIVWSSGPATGLKASADDQNRVTLTWKAPTDNGGAPVTRYWIHVSDVANFPAGLWTQKVVDDETTTTIEGLTAGKTYYFRVFAGNEFNILRGQGSVTTATASVFLPITPTSAPPLTEPDTSDNAIPANQVRVPNSVGQFTVRGEFFNLLTNSPETRGSNPEMIPVIGRVVFVPDVRSPLTVYPEDVTFVPTEIHAWIRTDGVLVAPADGFLDQPVKIDQFDDKVNLIAPSQLSLSIRNWSWTVHVVPTPGEEWEAFSLRIPGDTVPESTIWLNEEYINTHTTDLTRRRDPGVRSSRLYEVDFTSSPYPFGFDDNLDFLVLNEDLSMWKVYD